MSGISTEMKVTGISQYKSAMSQANQSVKTLDAQLKQAEAQFKATGDKEQYMADKAKLLKQRIEEQQKAAKQAEQAMKTMRTQGVDPSSASYQKMAQELAKAQTGILETTVQLDNLARGEMEAAKGADQLTASVNGISKKISLDQVIGGIGKITGALEGAAKKAGELGQALFETIMERAAWADDTATAASRMGMDVEQFQAYRNVFDTIAELSIADWATAQRRINDAINGGKKIDAFAALGIDIGEWKHDSSGKLDYVVRDWESVFWDAAGKLRQKVENGQLTQGQADVYAEAIFGKKYMDFKPLLDLGQDAFKDAVNQQKVVSKETVEDMAKLNDEITNLKQRFQTLQTDVLGRLAPALQSGAETITGLLDKLIEFLEKPEGQKMLEDLGTAVSGLFEDLSKIDPEQVVSGFTDVFTTITDGLKWMVENKETLTGLLTAIVAGWAGAKLTGGALQVLNLMNGLQGLRNTGSGGGGSASTGGGGGGGFNLIGWGKAGLAALLGIPMIDKIIHTDWSQFWEQSKATAANTPAAISSAFKSSPEESRGAFRFLLNEAFGTDFDTGGGGSHGFGIPVEPKPVDNSAEIIQQVIGPVPITLVPRIAPQGFLPGTGRTSSMMSYVDNLMEDLHPKANGLPFVPFDGYPALLHRGEQVVPARAVNSSNYSSNLYVEHMTMNGGIDADGLAARMAAAQKRTMSGYGS